MRSNAVVLGSARAQAWLSAPVRRCTVDLVDCTGGPIGPQHPSSCLEVVARMDTHASGLKPESWLVAAGRPSEPGAPLNVPPIPASNFLIGSGRAYARDDGTP